MKSTITFAPQHYYEKQKAFIVMLWRGL